MKPGDIGEPWKGKPVKKGYQAKVKYMDWNGVRREAAGSGRTQNEAKRAAVQRAQDKLRLRPTDGKVLTFNEVADLMLDHMKAGDWAGSTVHKHRGELRRNIRPNCGGVPITDFTPASCLATLDAAAQRDINIAPARVSMKQVLAYAVSKGWLDSNPLNGHSLFGSPKARDLDVKALTVTEAQALLALLRAAEDPTFSRGRTRTPMLRQVCVLLFTTGMRINQVLALRWEDLYLDDEVPFATSIHSVMQPAGQDVLERDPNANTKTRSSDVIFTLHPAAVAMLRERRKQTKWRWDNHLVFAHEPTGKAMPYGTLYSALKRSVAGTDLEWVNFHSIRKTMATELKRRGKAEDAIDLLGHVGAGNLPHYIADRARLYDAATAVAPVLAEIGSLDGSGSATG